MLNSDSVQTVAIGQWQLLV